MNFHCCAVAVSSKENHLPLSLVGLLNFLKIPASRYEKRYLGFFGLKLLLRDGDTTILKNMRHIFGELLSGKAPYPANVSFDILASGETHKNNCSQ